MSLDTFLLWHFDLFNSLTSPNYLFSSGRDSNIIHSLTLKNTIPWEFDSSNYMNTNIYDFSSNNGLTFSFEFKINSLPIDRFVFYLVSDYIYQFSLVSNAGITINYSGLFLTTFSPVDPNYWYKAVFIVSFTDKTDV